MGNGMDLERIKQWIVGYVKESPDNNLHDSLGLPAWDNPLLGVASGDDILFEDYKKHVGPLHWTPFEAFRDHFPEWRGLAADLSVIVWVLPHTERTRSENGRQKKYPSESWVRSRIYGEQMNESLRRDFGDWLRDQGVMAFAPVLSSQWKRFGYEYSTWSERHAAYAAGLGTFGLCDGLITPRGKAVRIGSVIAAVRLDPTERPYENHHEYCLYFSRGTCGACINRCPAKAISAEGHDKSKCSSYCHGVIEEYSMQQWGLRGHGCGLCQTAVPCEERIP